MTWPWPNPTERQPQQGWQCPVCLTVMAPWMARCTQQHQTTAATSTNREQPADQEQTA